MKSEFLKKFWPILFLLFFWALFACPYFIKGKVPFPSTYQVNAFAPWASYPHNGVPIKNGAMPDIITQIYPWRHLAMEEWKSGHIPLWNPYSFGGTPLLANYQSAVLSPFNILFFVFPFIDGWSILVLLQPLLAGLFTYLFVRKLSVGKTGSLISSVAFMFCGFITVWMSYGTLGYAILFLPLALFSLEGYFQEEKKKYLLLLAGSFPLSFFSGHFQMSLYFFIIAISYFLFLSFSNKFGKQSRISGLIILFGTLLALPQILPSVEFYSQSVRGGLFQAIEVIPWAYLPTLFAPDFFGNAVTRNDWFGHYAEWNGYIGVVPLLLGLYAGALWKNKQVKFFVILAIVSVFLAFPTPLGSLLVFFKIPVLSTSAASRIIVLFSFSLAILAGFGFDAWMKSKRKFILSPMALLFLLIGWGIIFGKFGLSPEHYIIARQNFVLPSLLLLTMLIVSSSAQFIKNKSILIGLGFSLLLVSSFDMYRFATKWMPYDPKSLAFEKVGAYDLFAKIAGYKRVLGNYDEHVPVLFHLPSLEGYDPLYPRRTGEFVASLSTGRLTEGERSVVTFPRYGNYTRLGMDLLGFSYLAHKKSDDSMPWTFQYWKYPASEFSLISEDSAYRILQNNSAYPRAFLVTNYTVENDPQKILDIMFDKKTDLSKSIVLEKNPHASLMALDKSVRILFFSPNVVTLKTQTDGSSLLFLSDTFYPGWHAYIDGKETEILRADFAFRAILLPKGSHVVKFSYLPIGFVAGIIFFSIGIAGIGAVLLRRRN